MNYEKVIISNLINYLIYGNINTTPVQKFDGGKFPSVNIKDTQFQFFRKYEDAENCNDINTIPVVLITTPTMYLDGKILYKNQYQSLKTLLMTDTLSNKPPVKYFVVPYVQSFQGNRLGSIQYLTLIDSIKNSDPFLFISNEISQIIKKLYYKTMGKHHHIQINDENKGLWFVPKSIQNVDTGATIHRIQHSYNIRSCYLD